MTQKLLICPECSATRKKKNVKSMSINTESGLFLCHHCGHSGKNEDMTGQHQSPVKALDIKLPTSDLPNHVVKFLKERGISQSTLRRNKIGYKNDAIIFPYLKHGKPVNVKYRTLNKKFRQETGAEKIFYGIDDIIDHDTVIIVEGEIDKLSLEEAGYTNVLSVPDGAPAVNTKSYETKFSYIKNCEKELEGIIKIVIAVDGDAPGKKLEHELARRLDPARCWRVRWPYGCKDANEVLTKLSSEELRKTIDSSKPVPIEGIFTIDDLSADIDMLYELGLQGGVSTGWPNIDQLYTVKPGEVTVITGIPSHGKSSWQTALMVKIAIFDGWSFGVFSPENQPMQRHFALISALYHGKPFMDGLPDRLTKDELDTVKIWADEHFIFILPPDDQLSIDDILVKAKVCVSRYGINGLVIDPWNEIDHSRLPRQTETEYISDCLTKIRRFARLFRVHVWIVAHPTKMYKDNNGKYPVPTPYDIAGSAHFRNKADNCISIWRDLLSENKEVEIHVQKVRFREVGKVGHRCLDFDITTGRYEAKSY